MICDVRKCLQQARSRPIEVRFGNVWMRNICSTSHVFFYIFFVAGSIHIWISTLEISRMGVIGALVLILASETV